MPGSADAHMYKDDAAASGHLPHSAAGRGHCAPYSERYAQRARAAATRRDEEKRLAALQYKMSKYQHW
eukprot:1418615-Pleurochrysis_carterae.AAC.2